jgi:hemerythrin-like metal-binding protein
MDAWSTALDVGHAEMDQEHRGLYDLTHQAAGRLEQGDADGVRSTVSALFAASQAHFEHEEALMAESGFAAADHRQAHRAFMADFAKLRAEVQARGLSPLFRLWFGSRFQDWLRYHIRGQDVQFYRHLRQWQEAQARQAEARLIEEAAAATKEGGGEGAAARAPPPRKPG